MIEKRGGLIGKEGDPPGDVKDHCLCDHASGSYWGYNGAGEHAEDHWPDRVPDLLLSNRRGGVLHKKPYKILTASIRWARAVGASL